MKYYSKSPGELRQKLENAAKKEIEKKKKSYLLQFANIGILMATIFLMLKIPGLMKSKKEMNVKNLTEPVYKTMDWKDWSIKTECVPEKTCNLTMMKLKETFTPDAFFWEIKDLDTGNILVKSFELIPKTMRAHEEKMFNFSIESVNSSSNVELHFINNKNEEVLMMRIFP
ncbi:MAG: hypothetical protein OEV78_07750 [Spirochaetia bacterium]|nr:hypothetical protein [Spirochaetia bacterium]